MPFITSTPLMQTQQGENKLIHIKNIQHAVKQEQIHEHRGVRWHNSDTARSPSFSSKLKDVGGATVWNSLRDQ